MSKVKIKVGMYGLKVEHLGVMNKITRKVMIIDEYAEQYLVDWGNIVYSELTTLHEVIPRGNLVNKSKVYNVKEKEISKFKYWRYKYWDSNF